MKKQSQEEKEKRFEVNFYGKYLQPQKNFYNLDKAIEFVINHPSKMYQKPQLIENYVEED